MQVFPSPPSEGKNVLAVLGNGSDAQLAENAAVAVKKDVVRERINMQVELVALLQDGSRAQEVRDIPTDFTEVILSRLASILPFRGGGG